MDGEDPFDNFDDDEDDDLQPETKAAAKKKTARFVLFRIHFAFIVIKDMKT